MLPSPSGAPVTLAVAGDASRTSSQDLPVLGSTRQPAEVSCQQSISPGLAGAPALLANGALSLAQGRPSQKVLRCSQHGSARASQPLPAAPRHPPETGVSWLPPVGGLDEVSLLGRVIALNSKEVGCPVPGLPRPRPMLRASIATLCVWRLPSHRLRRRRSTILYPELRAWAGPGHAGSAALVPLAPFPTQQTHFTPVHFIDTDLGVRFPGATRAFGRLRPQ